MRHTVGIAATAATAAIATALMAPEAEAQSDGDSPMVSILAVEIATLREQYEARIRALEEQIGALQSRVGGEMADHDDHAHDAHDDHDDHDDHGHGMADPHDDGAMLNPEIGAVLRGMFTSYSSEEAEIPGFQLGHESERLPEGFSLGHSELSLSSDIGDTIHAGLVLGIGLHPGEPAELEVEEAYVRTLPGSGLPDELTVTAGRKLWSFGYLNERHAHEDDFADRSLPYRAFLDGAFNDDGIQLSLELPGDVSTTVGGGLFRGDDRPFGGSDNGRRAYSAFARIGGDMGRDSSWRIGASILGGEVISGGGGHGHAGHGHGDEHDENGHDEHDHDEHDEHDEHDDDEHDDDEHDDDENGHDEHDHDEHDHDEHDEHDDDEHDDEHDHDEHDDDENGHDEHDHVDEALEPSSFFSDGVFSGDRELFGTDVRFAWAPTGNARHSQLILQGEYLWQTDNGVYTLTDDYMEEHQMTSDGRSAGWYAQAVYKFLPEWRVGMRYSQLSAPSAAETGHSPSALAIMGDWTSDRFGQIRLQYNREVLESGHDDNQFILQYTVSLGGHAGHDH